MIRFLLVMLRRSNGPQLSVISVIVAEAAHTLQCVALFICDTLQVRHIKYIFEHIFNLMMDLPRLITEKFDCLLFFFSDGN